MALTFPASPTVGQQYVGDNTVTYIYTGDRWSAALAIHNGTAQYVVDGGVAASGYINLLDNTLDGGGA